MMPALHASGLPHYLTPWVCTTSKKQILLFVPRFREIKGASEGHTVRHEGVGPELRLPAIIQTETVLEWRRIIH